MLGNFMIKWQFYYTYYYLFIFTQTTVPLLLFFPANSRAFCKLHIKLFFTFGPDRNRKQGNLKVRMETGWVRKDRRGKQKGRERKRVEREGQGRGRVSSEGELREKGGRESVS